MFDKNLTYDRKEYKIGKEYTNAEQNCLYIPIDLFEVREIINTLKFVKLENMKIINIKCMLLKWKVI